MKQLELSIWNQAIDKKQLEIKTQRLKRRNEWIRHNLPYMLRTNEELEREEANIKGMK